MNWYTRSEVKRHNTINDCWLIARYRVYNVSTFLILHPEHIHVVLPKAGTDVSNDYLFHLKSMKKIWKQYYIGYINPFVIKKKIVNVNIIEK